MTQRTLRQLADELAMHASQIRESASGEGEPPHPWRLDDWMSEYRELYKRVARTQRRRPNASLSRGPEGDFGLKR